MKTLLFNKGENMKVLVLSSGGDAPGMNKFVCQLYKSFKSDLYFAYAGFSGLIDGQIFAFKDVYSKDVEDKAGSVIHSSRCPEFKQKKYFAKALENAKQFDVVVIMGGNGSERGANELFENGVNTIFVPGTIDNDVDDSFYSIGFSTAVKEGVYAIENTMPSIETMGNVCLFEVMGRECDKIALVVAKQTNADYVINDKKSLDFDKIEKIILAKNLKNESACIVVRENIMPVDEIAKKINEDLNLNIAKYHIVGRTQRGGKPTSEELLMAKRFADLTAKCIKENHFGVRILADENKNVFSKSFKNTKQN